MLDIRAVEARHVPKMDLLGVADPFLKITVDSNPEVYKTKYIVNSECPFWDQHFYVPIKSIDPEEKVHVELIDHDEYTDDDPISSMDFKLSDFHVGETVDHWFNFKPAPGVQDGAQVRLVFKLTQA